jgi:hypothetical protein
LPPLHPHANPIYYVFMCTLAMLFLWFLLDIQLKCEACGVIN